MHKYTRNESIAKEQRQQVNTNAWVTFTDDITRKMSRLISDIFITPRRIDVIYNGELWKVRKWERRWRDKNANNTTHPNDETYRPLTRPKSNIFNRYGKHLNERLRAHTSLLWHTNHLLQYADTYQQDNIDTNIIHKAILIHDLAEGILRDVTQKEWKTDVFRFNEYQAGKDAIRILYKYDDTLYQEMLEIYEQLQDKESVLYKLLKVYENFSDIDGIITLHREGIWPRKWKKWWDEIIYTLGKLREQKDEYQFIATFLQNKVNRLEKIDGISPERITKIQSL